MTISYSQSDVKKIADSLAQAIDELGRVGNSLDDVAEAFKEAEPDPKWSTAIRSESESISNRAREIADDLKSEISKIKASFDQLSVAAVNFVVQNAELEDATINAIKGPLPDDVDGNIDNINPLGKES